jgi:peptidoglycan/LPS O-acetylase OafA/YrhL
VPLALVLTFVLDSSGVLINHAFYSHEKVLPRPESVAGYLSSLFFVNEYQIFHFGGIAPGTNAPLWSLSFEATYYVIAGLILFVPRRFSGPIAILVLFAAGRTITAMFPLWILGFLLYRFGPRLSSWPRLLLLAGFAATLSGVVEARRILRHVTVDNFGYFFPWGLSPFNRDLVLDYGVALLFSANLLMARAFFERVESPNLIVRRVGRWFGDLTFPLYAMHFPILCFVGAISPWPATSYANLLFLCASVFLIVFALRPICDWLKIRIRKALSLPERIVERA